MPLVNPKTKASPFVNTLRAAAGFLSEAPAAPVTCKVVRVECHGEQASVFATNGYQLFAARVELAETASGIVYLDADTIRAFEPKQPLLEILDRGTPTSGYRAKSMLVQLQRIKSPYAGKAEVDRVALSNALASLSGVLVRQPGAGRIRCLVQPGTLRLDALSGARVAATRELSATGLTNPVPAFDFCPALLLQAVRGLDEQTVDVWVAPGLPALLKSGSRIVVTTPLPALQSEAA